MPWRLIHKIVNIQAKKKSLCKNGKNVSDYVSDIQREGDLLS